MQKCTYMDTDTFIAYIEIKDTYAEIEKDIEARFDTLNYKLDRPQFIGKDEKQNLN